LSEHILFLTGRLAEPQLRRVLAELADLGDVGFTWEVRVLGVQVAALMTADMIRRRLSDIGQANRILLPGRCRGDLCALSQHFGIPVERGPDELMDLPEYFGKQRRAPDLSRHDVRIFAELVDAPRMSIDAILAQAAAYVADGADVIDIGGLPQTPFPHLEESVQALKAAGYRVSVDSLDPDELLRGGRAGADYLLSLTLDTLHLADEVAATPVLIPARHGDLDNLIAAMQRLDAQGRAYLADPILDPLPFGFAASLARYHELRRRMPQAEILMGTGNVSELTDADTAGIHALLLGIMAELNIRALLTTQVSPHCRSAVREIDAARRLMFAAKEAQSLPRDFSDALLGLRQRKPFPYASGEIAEMARAVKDPSFRIQVSPDGLHIYNRDGLHRATDPFQLWPHLKLEQDGGHAFYLGVELARAQIAWQLGKRYSQDQELAWGCMGPRRSDDLTIQCAPGSTRATPAEPQA
jgi:dihydropteroate synthase-like protein